jgi:ceramide glucosyltransferase
MLSGILGVLAILSFILMLWQWLAAWRFPLHRRGTDQSFVPAVTLLKPLKGCDEHTAACLRSWLAQNYAGQVQTFFAVADAKDPACAVVKQLLAEFPQRDAQLVVCPKCLGANAKVSQLAQLEPQVKYEIIVVSDADVKAPVDLLANAVALLRNERVGLVNCFYQLANPTTLAMRWEAIASNADFWTQVLQSQSLKPLDFALGAVMVTRRTQLAEIGGFRALVDCLADDYQLGHRIAKRGYRIELCPVVVECWSSPMSWGEVWRHQLRWARTIRVCQPLPYFFSLLSNATLWPLLWLFLTQPHIVILTHSVSGSLTVGRVDAPLPLVLAVSFLAARVLTASLLQRRLTRTSIGWVALLLVPWKDLAQVAIWAGAFLGDHVEWRGERYRLRRDGTLEKTAAP